MAKYQKYTKFFKMAKYQKYLFLCIRIKAMKVTEVKENNNVQ